MCGIAGFYSNKYNYLNQSQYFTDILNNMNKALFHRGPDEQDIHLSKHFGLAHTRLSIIDLENGGQPMMKKVYGYTYGIVYNGEIYNALEIRKDLEDYGWVFDTNCDTEVILLGYLQYGADIVNKLNGIFAFGIMSEREDALYLFRDRAGVKPLYYTYKDNNIIFASELKGLFQFPNVNPQVDMNGLNEVFSIGPAKTYGKGVFKNIEEVLPGSYIKFSQNGKRSVTYWKLESHTHADSYEETLEKTRFLVEDSIKRQMVSDVPICTFLSGGVDSSIVTAVCSKELEKQGKQMNTFSFDFKHNDKYFMANAFQPSQDRPYVDIMVDDVKSNHIYLECDSSIQADYLYKSVDSRDLPTMADVDSSLLYFCSLVKDYNKVVLTGECADEIFGGYPWFHKEEFFNKDTFPWTTDLEPRKTLLRDDFIDTLNMEEYVENAYRTSVNETPRLNSDSEEEARRREISYLNEKWFMQTLLDRMDRTSMYSGLEARVPYADHRILEYMWNVPWNMKSKDGEVKHILRESFRGYLPDEVLFRRKSPYPKTYDPGYERILIHKMIDVIEDTDSPINQFIDKQKVYRFMSSPSNYGKPWYGQLMAGPQMLAYMIQVNYWLEKYKVQIV